MKVESSNLSKLFAVRLKSPETPKDKVKSIESGLQPGVDNTLEAAKSLTAVSKNPESADDVANAVKEASTTRLEDVDGLVESLKAQIPANPREAFAAQVNNIVLQKVGELLR